MLTSVHTAAGYNKQAGTPAVLTNLTLTRVRYPIAEIGSGDCVFSAYIGYVTFDAEPAVIPGTPPDSVVNTIVLAPKYGGAAAQSLTFTGPRGYSSDRVRNPTSSWMPFLDPTLEYCATITSFGNGDVARLALKSKAVCARVQEISLPGAGDDASADAPTTSGSGETAGDAGTATRPPPTVPFVAACPAPAPTAGIALRARQGFCSPALDDRPAALRPIYKGVSVGHHEIYCTLPGGDRVLAGTYELQAWTHPDLIVLPGPDGHPTLGRPK